jgi:hypothetical protein
LPLSARDLEKEVAASVAPIQDTSLKTGGSISGKSRSEKGGSGKLSLIGTIGDRALFHLPDGSTTVLSIGSSFETNDGIAKLIAVGSHSADILVRGKRVTIQLEAAPSLVSEAIEQYNQEKSTQGKSGLSPGNELK